MEVVSDEISLQSSETVLDEDDLPGEPTRAASPPAAPPGKPPPPPGPIAGERTKFGPAPKAPPAPRGHDPAKSTMTNLLDELEGEMLEDVEPVEEDGREPPPRPSQRPPAVRASQPPPARQSKPPPGARQSQPPPARPSQRPPPPAGAAISSPGTTNARREGTLQGVAAPTTSPGTTPAGTAVPNVTPPVGTPAKGTPGPKIPKPMSATPGRAISGTGSSPGTQPSPAKPSIPGKRLVPPAAPPRAAPPGAPRSPADAAQGAPEPPRDPFTADALAMIKTCETELAQNPDPLRAARLHYEIGRLYEMPIADPRRAAAHYQEALTRAPEHLPTIRAARRVLIARKSYQQALPLFEAEARITKEPRRKAALYYAKGRLLEDVMGVKAEARQAYTVALELDRSDPGILKAIEQCEIEADAWGDLARTYERAANAVASDARHRAALLIQRAHLLESKQNDVEAAIELYEKAIDLDPAAYAALEALKRLHHARKRWRDLIRVLEHEAQLTTDSAVRTMALYRIGRLHNERLGSRDEALAALERAVKESPRDPLVLDELSRLYDAADRPAELAEMLRRLVETTQEARERIGNLHRIGQLCEERLDDDDAAVRWYEGALAIEPTYVPALQALGRLYVKRQEWTSLVRMHLAEAGSSDDAKRRAAAHTRVAEVFEVNLGRPEDAMEHHARALSLVPGYPAAFKALTRLFAAANKWRELVELYERAVDQARDKERGTTWLFKIGAIYEDHLDEPQQAAHAYRRVLGLDGNNLGAIHALQRANERAQRWPELVEALELEAEKTRDDDQVVALLHRAGEILDEKIGDRDAALARFRKVLGVQPTYVPALVSLGRIYYRSGRWEDLLEMYRRELELTPRGPGAVALLHKMGELAHERLGREDDALAHWRRAIENDPTHGPTLRALSRKLRERGDWAELVKVLELEHSGLQDPAAKARTSFRVGEVYEERLGQSDRALNAYEQAVKTLPDYRPAIDALARLRAEKRAWPKLVDDLEREATGATDQALAMAALMRQGEIWADELGEPKRAASCFERVLQIDPTNVRAMVALEPIYRRLGAWAELAGVLATEARVLTDVGARVTALRELARLYETRGVGGADEARVCYETILSLAPDDAGALEALERIALEKNDRALLATVDRRLVARSEDPAVAAAYQTRLAESLEAAGDPTALDAFRTALTADPESLGATRGLTRIAERTDDPMALAEAARREAGMARTGDAAARLLVRSAIVRAERLGDTRGAIADLERALELWPDHPDAAERLGQILLAKNEAARYADLLARAAGSAQSPERIAALWLEVARLQADVLDNLAGGIGALNRVLRSAPNHVPTLRRLAELYGRDGQWTESVNLLGKVVQLAPDRDILREAHLTLAAIWAERLNETSRALVSLQAVLAIDAENREALARLADLQEREGKSQQASDAARRLVKASQEPRDRAAALARLARIEKNRGHDAVAADALREAIALEGPDSEAAEHYRKMAKQTTDWAMYGEALTRYLSRAQREGLPLATTFLELARVQDERLVLKHDAISTLQRGLEQTNEDPLLRRELVLRLRATGRHAEAVTQIQQLIEAEPAQAAHWREMARTAEEMRNAAEVKLATQPLVVLGAANEAEQKTLLANPPRPAHARPMSFTPDVLRTIVPFSRPEAAAADVLATLGEALAKLYPPEPELESFGLSTRDRVTQKQGHPLRLLADRIASLYGGIEYDLYVHRVRGRGLALLIGDPPAIVVPGFVMELPESAQTFILGRALANVVQRHHAVDKLTPRELEVLLASAARLVQPGFGAGLTSEDFLDEQARRIHKALSRKMRKSMDDAAQRYVAGPRVEFPAWASAAHRGAVRVAALICDDLVAAVDSVRRSERDLTGLEGAALVRQSELVGDLFRFWMSEPALALRRRAGMIAGA